MSNCLYWAVYRWFTRGGYLVVRKSHFGPWPHFSWSRKLKVFWAYHPIDQRINPWNIFCFYGRVRREK